MEESLGIFRKYSFAIRGKGFEAELLTSKKALALLTECAEETQAEFGKQLSDIVTNCLEIVFQEDKYEFEVAFESKRNATSVKFLLKKNGFEQELTEATGGGVLNVCAVGLRLALHQMKMPQSRNTIILDESLSNLRGRDNTQRVYQLLDMMCKKLNLQIIVVSNVGDDVELLESYNVITVQNIDGVAHIS